jgi:hypothetical protein
MTTSTFCILVAAVQFSFLAQAVFLTLLSTSAAPSLNLSGMGALATMAEMPAMNSMPMAMKCLWTSGSMSML